MKIDWWTLGLQTVNVIVLVWLLAKFFWRPLAAMIEQRRATAQQLLDDAAAKRTEATTALAAIAKTRAGFAQERDSILAAAHAAAEKAHAARLAQATQEAAALQTAARAAMAAERSAAETAQHAQSSQLAVDIAKRLAARLDGAAVRAAFLDWLLAELRALPAHTRAAAANGDALQMVSATPLTPAEQDQARTAVAAALGTQRAITFSADPALIAGLELRGAHLSVTNSWRADLARIRAELPHG